MNKIQFDKLIKPLVALYDEIELDLIMNILERIDNYSNIKGSLEWYLDKLSETKLLDKDNLKVLKQNKRKIKQIIIDIADACGGNIDNLEQLKGYYQNNLISVDPTNLYDSIAIQNLIREATKDTDDIMNLINTKAFEGAKESYKKVLNKAYSETASGVYTYTEAIRRAMNEMAQQGIQTVNYESGFHLSIESVVRRDVVTRMNKLVGDCELEHAKQLETNLVYVNQHLGARVRTKYMKNDYEAHCEWQGKKYMIEGSSEEYPNLYETTGYGEMLGLKGINCYHNMRPTWEWEKVDDVIDEAENAIEYEKLQRQRALERKSRELKRKIEVAKYFDDKEEIKKINDKLKQHNEEYDNWLKDNGLTRDYNREYIIKSKVNIPNFIGKKQQGTYSRQEILELTEQVKYMSDKYIDIPSKWSGNIVINNEVPSGKKWNCDIITNNTTSAHELLHEILHSKSISYYDVETYKKHWKIEEASVQLLNQEISQKEGIEIIPSDYDEWTNILRKINKSTKRYENDYLFAKNLFKQSLPKRFEWLSNIASDNKEVIDLLEELK